MFIKNCRVCSQPLLKAPLLHYRGMPKAAQFLPSKKDLPRESGVSLDICQCSGCGLVQLAGPTVPYYREVIRAAAFSPEMGAFRQRQFKDFVRKYGLKGRKVIELGCGKGEYLSLMGRAGVKVYGLENSPSSVKYCRDRSLRVSRGFLDSRRKKLQAAPFHGFYILNFLEHLPDPNALLSGMRANLSPGGVGLVEVPDFDMMLRENVFSEFIPDHLFYFTRDTLRFLLALNGFDVLSLDTVWHGYILSAVVRSRLPMDLSGFRASEAAIRRSVAGFLSGFRRGRVAVWGAGHQSLAVIASAGLSGKIPYVVDSAPFKQGRYTPATHIPIVSPETLYKHRPDAVLVMTASYSDEVAGILRRKYGRTLKIAVLRTHGLEILR